VKIAFVTQELDPEHPALAQTVDLVRALAARTEEVAVATRRVACDLPANVVVETFDSGGKLGRGVAFERAVTRASAGADAVLVHMVPQFALLAAPVARARRAPLLLWYTHWHASRSLRAATRIVDVVLSVDTSSFPLATDKLRATGHAIDVSRFDAAPLAPHDGPLRLLALGRTARWKGLGTLIEAIAKTSADVELDIRGPSLTDDERAHRTELERLAAALPVRIQPAVARADVPVLFAAADLVVSPNEPATGATLDKAVFEAAACRRPVLSTNAAFGSLLGGVGLPLVAAPRDASALAAAIDAIAGSGGAARRAAGEELRARVVAHHSLDHWADQVIRTIREVRSPRGKAGIARQAAG
jgi:glycosyltransferase involved in cell wall biosynthesis